MAAMAVSRPCVSLGGRAGISRAKLTQLSAIRGSSNAVASLSLSGRGRRPARVARQTVAAAASAGSLGSEQQQNRSSKGLLGAWRQWWVLTPPSTAAGGSGSSKDESKEPPPAQRLPSLLGKVARLLAPDMRLLLAAVLFLVLAAMCELAIPALSTRAVFAAARERAQDSFRQKLLLLGGATAGYAIFAAIRGGLFALINTNMLQRLRSRVFERLICQPVAFYDAAEPAQLTSRLAADCSVISRVFSTSINVAMRNLLQVIAGASYLFVLSPQMTVALAGVSAVLVLVASVFGSFTRRAQRTYQDALAASNEVAEESFKLARLIRAFGTEKPSQERYGRALGVLRHISLRQSAAYALYVCCNNFLYNATRLATLVVGGTAAITGTVSAEQLTEFVMYTEFIASALLSVCDQWGPIMEGAGASERILTYLDAQPAPQIAPGTIPASSTAGSSSSSSGMEQQQRQAPQQGSSSSRNGTSGSAASSSTSNRSDGIEWRVDFKNVTFSYPSRPEVKALDDVCLTIPAGQLTALVGLSGSGKSTLIALMQRLYDPGEGAVLVGGHDLRSLDAAWFRSRVGVVSQDPQLFRMTVAENIALGFPQATPADIERAARLANAYDFIQALPQGFDTVVSDKLLSGGQRQRVAIARALVRDPALLILDEATSALDAESEGAVQAALNQAMRTPGRTIVVIAHRLSTVRNADQIMVLAAGRLAEQGKHSQLMRSGGIYAALVKRQSGAVLDQERDLAPHERQAASSASRSTAGSTAGESVEDGAGDEGEALTHPPDLLPNWQQQRRLEQERGERS